MIASVKQGVCRAAASTGLFRLSRMLSARMPRIIMYHGFCGPNERFEDCTNVTVFRRQLEHIRRYYHPMAFSELARLLADGRNPPERTVVVTVDDGYASFARWAAPLLSEFDIPATLFVVSGLAGTQEWLWADKFGYLCERAAAAAELSAARRVETLAALKRMTISERDARLAELAERANVTIPQHAPQRYALLSWKDLAELAAGRNVEIGAHTRRHPILSKLGTDDAWDEINGSRDELQRRLDVEVATFCYPNGKAPDYTPEQIEMVRRAGYVCAAASHIGWVSRESNRFALPRIGGDGNLLRFRKYLDGFEYWQRRAAGVCCS